MDLCLLAFGKPLGCFISATVFFPFCLSTLFCGDLERSLTRLCGSTVAESSSVPWVVRGWIYTAKTVIKLSAFADAFEYNLPSNAELECEQNHEYFLNKLPFATCTSCGLSPFVQVNESFLLLLPTSSHQLSCGYLQPHQIDPSIFH